jgi:hypothetical protein
MVDMLSKGIAGLAIALYASGFLIVSLDHSMYGFTETNPFRPKILAAGAWFFIFTAAPVVVVVAMEKDWFSWRQFPKYLYTYYIFCLSFATPAQWLFNLPTTAAAAAAPPGNWWRLGAAIAFVLAILFFINFTKTPPIVSVALSVLLVGFVIEGAIRQIISHDFGFPVITLWFFGVGIAAAFELQVRLKNLADSPSWKLAHTVMSILLMLLVFALYYYPHMKASWGGGSPINVVLYFNKDSAIKPNESVSVQLVDESDAGFYIVAQGESRAIFVPRNAVSLVYFSDKPSDSVLLK